MIAHAVEGTLREGSQSRHLAHGGRGSSGASRRIAENRSIAERHPRTKWRAIRIMALRGTVLGAVGMSLHHKLCHTLGGSFDLPHAETHAILIPHTAAYNHKAAEEALRPAAALFGGDLGPGLYDFAKALGAPLALRDLGLSRSGNSGNRAADIAVRILLVRPAAGRARRRPRVAARGLVWIEGHNRGFETRARALGATARNSCGGKG